MKKALFLTNCLHHRKFDDRYLPLASSMNVDVIGLDWYHGTSTDNPLINYDKFVKIKKTNPSIGTINRLKILSKILLTLISRRISGQEYELIIVNSYDLYIIANIAFIGKDGIKKIYDIADIHPTLTERGAYSLILNYIQNLFIKNWTIVVSSPWFYWGYLLKNHGEISKVYLLENFKTIENPWPKLQPTNFEKRIILWNGILRCENSAIYLYKLCKSLPLSVYLIVLGDVSQLSASTVENLISLKNVDYRGSYDLEKLESTMAEVHYIWCAEAGQDLNSKLLLPNRIYDCLYYSRAAISIGDNAISKAIQHFGIGAVISTTPGEGPISFLTSTSPEDFNEYQSNLAGISKKYRSFDEFLEIANGKSTNCLTQCIDTGVLFGGKNESNRKKYSYRPDIHSPE